MEFVPKTPVGLDRTDRDQSLFAVTSRAKIEFIVIPASHRFTHELRPEFWIFFPTQPFDGPAIFHIRRERGRFTQSILPSRQERVMVCGFKQHLISRLGFCS